MRDPHPLAIVALVVVVVLALTWAAVGLDGVYRDAHRAQWIDECRARCVSTHAESWSYNYRNGCSCGGEVKP